MFDMVVCVHLPRFELTVAAGGAEALAGHALAIAPAPGGEARVGEVSGAAEAQGVTRGMALGEALARCPRLRLVAGDPLGVAQEWGRAAGRWRGSARRWSCRGRPRLLRGGRAARAARGRRGGDRRRASRAGTPRPRGRRPDALLRARRGAGGALAPRPDRRSLIAQGALPAVQGGAAVRRGSALHGSAQSGHYAQPDHREARRYLANRPVELLGFRAETAALVEPLTRLGIARSGSWRRWAATRSPTASARPACSRGAWPAARTTRCARAASRSAWRSRWSWGRPAPGRRWSACWACSSTACWRAPSGAGGRCARCALRAAGRGRHAGASGWSSARRSRTRGGCAWRSRLRLALLPAPAADAAPGGRALRPAGGRAGSAVRGGSRPSRAPDGTAGACARPWLRCARLAGPEAALRAVCVDPDSRVPERRVVLTPFPEMSEHAPSRGGPVTPTCRGPRACGWVAGRRAADGRRPADRVGARVLAGRGPLVDAQPLRRRYWELVSARGRNLVVFHDLCSGGWFRAGCVEVVA